MMPHISDVLRRTLGNRAEILRQEANKLTLFGEEWGLEVDLKPVIDDLVNGARRLEILASGVWADRVAENLRRQTWSLP